MNLYLIIMAHICLCTLSYSQEWANPDPLSVTAYVYAPGILASEAHLSRYCPSFIASTGETIQCSKGIEVMRDPVAAGNLAEIELKPSSQGRFLAGISYLITYFANLHLGLSITSAHKKERSLKMYAINIKKINVGQEHDIELLQATYDQLKHTVQEHDSSKQFKAVLYGTSRGSATAFNLMALNHPTEVCGLVLEGLFDSVDHLIKACPSWMTRLRLRMLHLTSFKNDGISPIDCVDAIPKDLPILLITSHKDTTVPCQCTLNIYKKLLLTGHNHVHILILKNASHVWYAHCHKQDHTLYESIVHAFYKQYGLPHIATCAQQGQEYFQAHTQPTVQEIELFL